MRFVLLFSFVLQVHLPTTIPVEQPSFHMYGAFHISLVLFLFTISLFMEQMEGGQKKVKISFYVSIWG